MRYANAAGRVGRIDIRHILNGFADSYLYRSGRIDTTLPFDELRRRSLNNEAARSADGASNFSSVLPYLPKPPVEAYNLSSAPVQPFRLAPRARQEYNRIYIVIPIHFLSGRCALRG